jgi:hypothetical protein
MKLKFIILLFLNIQPLNLESEYLNFKKDSMVLEYKRIGLIIDSLQKANEFSHVSTTATIAKRMIFTRDQSTFCNEFVQLDPLALEETERNICLVCKDDVLRTRIRKKYINLFKSEKYKKLVLNYLNPPRIN